MKAEFQWDKWDIQQAIAEWTSEHFNVELGPSNIKFDIKLGPNDISDVTAIYIPKALRE